MEETIAAIATAQGMGGIGIIRVSGTSAIKIVNGIFISITGTKDKLMNSKGYTAHYGSIAFNNEYIDEVIVTVFRAPQSYTGEDVVEISCHGGLYITRRILSLVIEQGARLAYAGEFTKRAFLNGKIGLTQAESIMDIISANGKTSARAALAVKNGKLYEKINLIKQELLDTAANISVWSDYPDEYEMIVNNQFIEDSLDRCVNMLKNLLSTYEASKAIKDGLYTVIIGKPNVGKSSIMNLLSRQDKSIVTDVPGTTRDVIEENVFIGDIYIRLADTAGIHGTSDDVEQIGVSRAKQQASLADLILIVFDASRELTQDDIDLIDLTKDMNTIAIINKTDLDVKLDVDYIKKFFSAIVKFSALKETGLEQLEEEISSFIGFSKVDPSDGLLATERQREAAQRAYDCIIHALDDLKKGLTFDVIMILIEDAIECLLELTGEHVDEKIVDRVFSKFCVGK